VSVSSIFAAISIASSPLLSAQTVLLDAKKLYLLLAIAVPRFLL
jgi:hypothetical protein